MLSIKRILCPTDFSEPAHRAITVAGELAPHFGAEICLAHVLSLGRAPAERFELMYPGPQEPLRNAADEQLQKLARELAGRGLRVTTRVAAGDPGHEIVRMAREENCDLVVIASQGGGMVAHVLIGSVAERVTRLADRPVLTVPARVR